MIQWIAAALLLSLSCIHAAEATPTVSKYKTKRVIILVIDGPRYSETWGDPARQYIPMQNKEMLPQGVLYTQFKNNGPTYTNAGHSALTTGFYQPINNSGKELPKNPAGKVHRKKLRDMEAEKAAAAAAN